RVAERRARGHVLGAGVDRARPVVGGPCEPRHQPPAHRAHAAGLSPLGDDPQGLAPAKGPPPAGVRGPPPARAPTPRPAPRRTPRGARVRTMPPHTPPK